mgnify:CR=1 FL=1
MKKLLLLLLCVPLIGFGQKKNKFAKDIEVSIDKFDGSTTWRSPMVSKTYGQPMLERVYFTKFKKDGEVRLYLSLTTNGSTLNVGEKGVVILFTDGDRLDYPNEKIDVRAGEGSFMYSAFIRLGEEEMDKFINKDIDVFQLYIYEGSVTPYPEFVKKKRKKIKGWALAIKECN